MAIEPAILAGIFLYLTLIPYGSIIKIRNKFERMCH